jgi:hypothetical protein
MGQFQGSLRLPGDSRPLPATVHLTDGRLQVASGEHVIGDWPINAIDISHVPEGIRVKAEGEVLLLEISDRDAFAQAAASLSQKPKRLSRPKRAAKSTKPSSPPPPKPVATKTARVKTPKPAGESKLDAYLAKGKERWGAKVPAWVFGRWGVAAAVALLALCVVFAEPLSNLLLITGVVVLLVGGVTMLDTVIARRLLHHKVTPIQVVIGGGSIFVAGLLVGLVA